MSNLEAIAAEYLSASTEAKAATKRASDLKKELEGLMHEGQEVNVQGQTYEWRVSRGASPRYSELVAWLKSVCTPDVSVLIEEGKHKFTGIRTTKNLELVEN